jgi:hypothetical protein
MGAMLSRVLSSLKKSIGLHPGLSGLSTIAPDASRGVSYGVHARAQLSR